MSQRDSQGCEYVGSFGFLFKIIVCIATPKLSNIIIVLFDMGNEKLRWKDVVATDWDTNSRNVVENIDTTGV